MEKKIAPRIKKAFDFISQFSDTSKEKLIKAANILARWSKFDQKHMYSELEKIKDKDVLDLLKSLKVISPKKETLTKKIAENTAKLEKINKLIKRLQQIFKGKIEIGLTDDNVFTAVKKTSQSVKKIIDPLHKNEILVNKYGQTELDFPPN